MTEQTANNSEQVSSSQNQTYEVKLTDVFEGPMDLLIHLIRKNEVNIYDIPIALITRHYLEYLEWMKAMNIDLAGEFLVMASTLTQIKSRMLLPLHDTEEGEEDPRLEIARPLIEYLQLQSAAEELSLRNLLGDQTFTRQISDQDHVLSPEDQIINVGLFELIDAFRSILETLPGDAQVDFTTDRVSVTDRITEIVDILEKKGSITFAELFTSKATKSELIVTFLALLEMVKLYLIRIVQHLQSGTIRIFYI